MPSDMNRAPDYERMMERDEMRVASTESIVIRCECFDCHRQYGDEYGFPDLVIPFRVWKEISPTKDDGGLLCPSCICARLYKANIKCEGAFMSGPIISVSEPVMHTMRRVENIELAIEGRDNRWGNVRELVDG